jgi:hypothetical protein
MYTTAKYMAYVYSSKHPTVKQSEHPDRVAGEVVSQSRWAKFNRWMLRWLWGAL